MEESFYDQEEKRRLIRHEEKHFDDEVTESGLVFDYRIKSGIMTKRNGLKLLAFLGYPKEIIDRLLPLAARQD